VQYTTDGYPLTLQSCASAAEPETAPYCCIAEPYQQGLAHHKSQKTDWHLSVFPHNLSTKSQGISPTDPLHHISPHLSRAKVEPTAHTVPLFCCGVLTPVLALRQFTVFAPTGLAPTG
jgi:hypothetical protein